LTWIEGNYYAVAFETAFSGSSKSALQIIRLDTWNGSLYVRPISSKLALSGPTTLGNAALQGIVFDKGQSDASTWVFYAVEEDAPLLWRIDYDVSSRTATTSPTGVSIATDDLSGIAIPPADPDSIFVLSDSTKKITKFSLPGGQALPLAGELDVSTFNDPAGLAFYNGTLYVIGEGSMIATYPDSAGQPSDAVAVHDHKLGRCAAY